MPGGLYFAGSADRPPEPPTTTFGLNIFSADTIGEGVPPVVEMALLDDAWGPVDWANDLLRRETGNMTLIAAAPRDGLRVPQRRTGVLIDEVATPDSSRFWPADEYAPGQSPPSFDKQFVRDYLESIGWDKRPPGPELPADIAAKTAAKYHEAMTRLTDDQ